MLRSNFKSNLLLCICKSVLPIEKVVTLANSYNFIFENFEMLIININLIGNKKLQKDHLNMIASRERVCVCVCYQFQRQGLIRIQWPTSAPISEKQVKGSAR